AEQRGVDGEVDGVAGDAHGAELAELDPIRLAAERIARAGADVGGGSRRERHRRATLSARRGGERPGGADDDVPQLPVVLAQPLALLPIEADLPEVEQHERREDLDLVVAA